MKGHSLCPRLHRNAVSIPIIRGWLPSRSRGAKAYISIGSLSIYLHDMLVRLPGRGDTEVHIWILGPTCASFHTMLEPKICETP